MRDLATRLIEHVHGTGEPPEAFGSLLGASQTLLDLVEPWIGASHRIAPGVEVTIPEGIQWEVSDGWDSIASGSVCIQFTDRQPVLRAQVGPLRATIVVESLVVSLGVASLTLTAQLRHAPDFTYRINLEPRP